MNIHRIEGRRGRERDGERAREELCLMVNFPFILMTRGNSIGFRKRRVFLAKRNGTKQKMLNNNNSSPQSIRQSGGKRFLPFALFVRLNDSPEIRLRFGGIHAKRK